MHTATTHPDQQTRDPLAGGECDNLRLAGAAGLLAGMERNVNNQAEANTPEFVAGVYVRMATTQPEACCDAIASLIRRHDALLAACKAVVQWAADTGAMDTVGADEATRHAVAAAVALATGGAANA